MGIGKKTVLLIPAVLAAALILVPQSFFAGQAGQEKSCPGSFAEGEVIVCRTAKIQEDEIKDGAAGSIEYGEDSKKTGELLDGAKTLFTLQDPYEEDDVRQTLPEDSVSGKKYAGASDEILIQLVRSDEYTTEELIDILSDTPGVISVEPDYILSTDSSLSRGEDGEPEIADTDIDLTSKQYAFGPSGINVPDWNKSEIKNAEGVVAVVMDTGVDYNHPDLKEVMWDEGEKYPALTALGGGKYGFNPGDPEDGSDPMDDEGHGTHIAGIIAAKWNGFGVSGAANGARIMAIRNVTGRQSYIKVSSCVKGYQYIKKAKEAGVNVAAVNCSFSEAIGSYALNLAVDELGKAGINVFFAASNESDNADLSGVFTAGVSGLSNVLVIGSSDSLRKCSGFTNYGVRTVHVFAPGSNIMSTYPLDMRQNVSDLLDDPEDTRVAAYAYNEGTSMATPAAVGAAVIAAANFPEDSAAKRAARILASAEREEELKAKCASGGIINVANLLDEKTYTPVVSSVFLERDGLHTSGWFFSETSKTDIIIKQGDSVWDSSRGDISIREVKKDDEGLCEIVTDIPENLKEGEVIITVRNRNAAEGRQEYTAYLTLTDERGYLSRQFLNLEARYPEELANCGFYQGTGLNGKLYLFGWNEKEERNTVWRFTPGNPGEFEELPVTPDTSCICAFNGCLIFMENETGRLALYDPEKGMIRSSVLNIKDVCFDPRDEFFLYNDGSDEGRKIILFRTPFDVKSYTYGKTEVWRADPGNLYAEYKGSLEGSYELTNLRPIISHNVRNGIKTVMIMGWDKAGAGSRDELKAEAFIADNVFSSKKLEISPENAVINTDYGERYSGAGLLDGVFLTGCCSTVKTADGTDVITNDNYYLSYEGMESGERFRPGERRIHTSRLYRPVTVAYNGYLYCFGYAYDEPFHLVGKFVQADTQPDYGDLSVYPEVTPSAYPAEPVSMKTGETGVLRIDNAFLSGNESISWSSQNKKVVTVKNGLITAKGPGNAVVNAVHKAGKEKTVFSFNVKVEEISLPLKTAEDKTVKLSSDKKQVKLSEGGSVSADAILTGEGYASRIVKVSSTNENILSATVQSGGIPESSGKKNRGICKLELTGKTPGTAYAVVESFDPLNPERKNRILLKVTVDSPAKEIKLYEKMRYAEDPQGSEDTLYLKKGSSCILDYTLKQKVCTDITKVSWSAKGGAVKVKNGVVKAASLSKKDKSGNLIPSTVRLKLGRTQTEIKVIVTG